MLTNLKCSLMFYLQLTSIFCFIAYNLFNCLYLIISIHQYLIFIVKIILTILLLILIRGGVPRFRYDHLSRIGWLNFIFDVLSIILIIFVFIIIL